MAEDKNRLRKTYSFFRQQPVYASGGGPSGPPGADQAASYLVVSLTSSLPNERQIAPGTGLKSTDGGSNNFYTLFIDDNVVATVSGTTFTGVTKHQAGLSGSLTRLVDGTSYIIAGSNVTVITGSNGAITISAGANGYAKGIFAGTDQDAFGDINFSSIGVLIPGYNEEDDVDVYKNGQLLTPGAGNDYTVPTDSTVRFNFTLNAPDVVTIRILTSSAGSGGMPPGGDITGVVAGVGLTGGGTSGTVTLNINDSVVATVSGTTFTGPVVSSANLLAQSDFSVVGRSYFLQNVDLQTDLVVSGSTELLGNTLVEGDLGVLSNFSVISTTDLYSDSYVHGNLYSSGSLAELAGQLIVYGGIVSVDDMSAMSNVDVLGDIYSLNNLYVSGSSIFSGTLTAENNVIVQDDLLVAGNSTFGQNVDVQTDLVVSGTAEILGNTIIQSDLGVVSNFSVLLTSDLYSDAYVHGNLYASSSVEFADDLSVYGNLTAVSAMAAMSNVDVLGDIYALNDVYVSGSSIMSGTLTVEGNLLSQNDFSVVGKSYFIQNVDVQSNLVVSGSTELLGNVLVQSDLGVLSNFSVISTTDLYSDAYAHGNLYSSGSVEIAGSLLGYGGIVSADDMVGMSNLDVQGDIYALNDVYVTGSVIANLGFSGSLTTLTDGSSYLVAGTNVTITSASNGQVTISSTGGSSTPAGNDTEIQFNNAGSFGASANLNFNSSTNRLSLTGSFGVQGDIIPDADTTHNLGSSEKRWANVYTGDLHLRNDRGDWTIVEERDYLCVINNITGKKYRMMLQPIED